MLSAHSILVVCLFGQLSAGVVIRDGQVRLVGGETPSEGMVEIYLRGEWGTICDDGWGIDDGKVVCRMLGHQDVASVWQRAHFGRGTGEIWLDNVECVGNEYSLLECNTSAIGEHDCSHFEDAGVSCVARPTPTSVSESLSTTPAGSIWTIETFEVQTFNLESGESITIVSPNYPLSYDSNTDITWVVSVPEGCGMTLRFDSFSTESYFDKLTVSDNSDFSRVVDEFTGYLIPPNTDYDFSTAWIRFHSDSSVTSEGFEAIISARCTEGTEISTAADYGTGIPATTADETTVPEVMSTEGVVFWTIETFEVQTFNLESGESVTIVSPNYPLSYDTNTDITWVVSVPEGCGMTLRFDSFSTESNYDKLTVSDNSDFSTVVDEFSGYLIPPSTDYDFSTAWIRFHSDSLITSDGFEAVISARCTEETPASEVMPTEGVAFEGQTFSLESGESVTILSPNHPRSYDSNTDITWMVSVPEGCGMTLRFVSFSTERSFDGLTIADNPDFSGAADEFSGQMVPPRTDYNFSSAWIRFHSDSSITSSGFEAIISARCAEGTEIPTTTDAYEVTGEVIVRNLQAVPLSASSVSVSWEAPAESTDLVTVYVVLVWDVSTGQLVSHSVTLPSERSLLVDDLMVGTEYLIDVTALGREVVSRTVSITVIPSAAFTTSTLPESATPQPVIIVEQGGEISLVPGLTYRISSPNFPSNYSSYSDVLWSVDAPSGCSLNVRFLSFSTESTFDFVKVGPGSTRADVAAEDEIYSGDRETPFDIIVDSRRAFVYFYSDGSVSYSGFEADLTLQCQEGSTVVPATPSSHSHGAGTTQQPLVPNTEGGDISLVPGLTYRISSPNFPSYYPSNSDVLWSINAPDGCSLNVRFLNFSTESSFDFVKVGPGSTRVDVAAEDRKYSGDRETPFDIIVDSRRAFVYFYSDGSIRLSGFQADLTLQCQEGG